MNTINTNTKTIHTIASVLIVGVFLIFGFATTESDSTTATEDTTTSEAPAVAEQPPMVEEAPTRLMGDNLPAELQGVYVGVMPAHNLRNENGPMIVFGKPVEVPAVEFYFTFSSDNSVSLRESAPSEGKDYLSVGLYEVIEATADTIKVKAYFEEDNMSGPEYTLHLSTSTLEALVFHNYSPRFTVTKRSYE